MRDCRSSPALAALVLFAGLLPAAADPAEGILDLPGTSWNLRGRAIVHMSARGQSTGARSRLHPGVLDFPVAGEMVFHDDTYGDLTGTWSPHETNPRRFVGEMDPGPLADLEADMEKAVRRAVRRATGRPADADVVLKGTSAKGKLGRTGEKLAASVRLRYGGTASVARVHIRFRATIRLVFHGRQAGG